MSLIEESNGTYSSTDNDDEEYQVCINKSLFPGYSLIDAAPLFETTPVQYLTDRYSTHGTQNPTLMEKPLWKHLIFHGHSAWEAASHFKKSERVTGVEMVNSESPRWCFKRFGATRTRIPDGRVVCVGGEHEDYYDPDFCIYNDVVVVEAAMPQDDQTGSALETMTRSSHPEGASIDREPPILTPDCIKIYGYPTTVFTPTDFHTATYIPHSPPYILIIGGLGYNDRPESTPPNQTSLYRLDLTNFSILKLEPSGACPQGRLHEHSAELLERGEETMVRVTTKDGERLGLRVRDMRWFD